MVAALRRLQATHEVVDPHTAAPAFATMKISGHGRGLARFFSTHPSLDTRIQRLLDDGRPIR
jgi:Zn-dependent protease with chaperone function